MRKITSATYRVIGKCCNLLIGSANIRRCPRNDAHQTVFPRNESSDGLGVAIAREAFSATRLAIDTGSVLYICGLVRETKRLPNTFWVGDYLQCHTK